MKTFTKNQSIQTTLVQRSSFRSLIRKSFSVIILCCILLCGLVLKSDAAGTWSALTTLATDTNAGEMILLSDGTVIAKARTGLGDGIGKIWNKLTPDANGSYANGT